ncbi:MAG TPA: phosphodiesterase [Candidatus Galloscillospira excrementipullorum]|nr:phosphodiesterase [Candidatus Galloscillospira excrementipullorum]
MKLLIASDLHGSTPCCEALLSRFEAEGADRLLFLGDLLYHGPRNDLPEGYRPKGVIPLLNGVKDKLLCVRGNCDAEVDQMVLEFPIMADYLMLELDSHRIFATHGHVYNRDNPPPIGTGDVLLHGHTHLYAMERLEHFVLLNPGSVTLPKGGNPKTYMTYEKGVFTLKTLEGQTLSELVL